MKDRLTVLLLGLYWTLPLCSQQQQLNPVKPSVNCEQQANALASGAYVYAVLDHVWPPNVPVGRGISLLVQFSSGIRVVLHSDAERYQMLFGAADIPGGNVWNFLGGLADTCNLPSDPAGAVKLLNLHWEMKDLTQQQFDQLHGDFLTAFTNYASTVRERSAYSLSTKLFLTPLDASRYTIVYDNTWEHFKIEELDLPIDSQTTSMVKWVHEFQSAVELAFHGKFVTGKGWTTQ